MNTILEEIPEEKPAWTSSISSPQTAFISVPCTQEALQTAATALSEFSKNLDREALRLALEEPSDQVTGAHYREAYENLTSQSHEQATPLRESSERFQFGPTGGLIVGLCLAPLIALWQAGQVTGVSPYFLWTMVALSVVGFILYTLDLIARTPRGKKKARQSRRG